MCRFLSEINQKDGFLNNQNSLTPPSSQRSFTTYNRISPVVLLVIIILAIVFFILGLLHLLIRFLKKTRTFSPIFNSNRYPETSGPNSLQRQLQQLFRQHDSGLDQAFIEALPVFYYKDIEGLKEQLDCAVCLCELSGHDKLRLLPRCSHAFHIQCIDTWLLSNSTCPLCRGSLLNSTPENQNPLFNNLELARQATQSHEQESTNGASNEIKQRVLSVRLGKFRSLNIDGLTQEAETSRCNLDARRCYSMGRVQYVENETNLQVSWSIKNRSEGDNNGIKASTSLRPTKSDSFSVSKIWLWSNKQSNKVPS